MPTVSLDTISNGDSGDATPVNSNFQELQAAVNTLDANNWGAGAIFAPSKLTQEAAALNEALIWNGTVWAHGAVNPAAMGAGGASAGQIMVWSGSAWVPTALTGTCLGIVEYNPTTKVAATTTSTTGADVDATNLSLTVTVPSTGKLMVMLSATFPASTSGAQTLWGLRESTTDIAYRKLTDATPTGNNARATLVFLLTGLSAGSHTYKFAFRATAAGTAGCNYGQAATPASSDPGPATMALYGIA